MAVPPLGALRGRRARIEVYAVTGAANAPATAANPPPATYEPIAQVAPPDYWVSQVSRHACSCGTVPGANDFWCAQCGARLGG